MYCQSSSETRLQGGLGFSLGLGLGFSLGLDLRFRLGLGFGLNCEAAQGVAFRIRASHCFGFRV
jgi:hypothetical protein